MNEAEINRMRRCFRVAAVWEEWSEQDQTEIAAAIREAIDAGDQDILAGWMAWLEDISSLERMGTLCRAAEERIRSERRKVA